MNWLLPPLPPKFEAALRDVRARKPESRMAAAERLGRAEGEELERARAGLRELAGDVHPGVRATALAAIGLVGGEDELDVVLHALLDEAAEVREFATVAAAQIGGERALAGLTKALTSREPEVRFQAVAGIAELAPDAAASLLLPLLDDRDGEVRAQVVSALGALEEPHLIGHLAGALEDDLPDVRLEAALALSAIADPRAEAPLLEALARRARVGEVARALAQLGCKKGNDQLVAIAEGWLTSPILRAELGAALLELGDERGLGPLRRALTGLRPDARSYAVELIRQVGAAALIPELVRLIDRPRGADLLAVVDALATFLVHSAAARSALSRLAQRSDAVGQAASRALAGQPAGPPAST